MWRPVVLALVALSLPSMARADGPLDAAAKELRAAPTVFTDGKGHFIALVLPAALDDAAPVFYGTRTTLYYVGDLAKHFGGSAKHVTASGGGRGTSWYLKYSTEQATTLQCRDREQPLQRVTGEQLRSYMSGVKVEAAPSWKRVAVRLGRDDEGTYYLVDADNTSNRFVDHRLFIGKRGAMTPVRLKDVVIDTSGDLYLSDRGTLKVVDFRDELAAEQKRRGVCEQRRPDMVWLSRGKQTTLVTVSIVANSQLIVEELGAYVNDRFGSPCDVF